MSNELSDDTDGRSTFGPEGGSDETIAKLEESQERLRLALQAGEMGFWELDLQTGTAPVHSPQHDLIFGYTEPLDEWNFETFLDHVHPDDRDRVLDAFAAAFETGKWEFECRIVDADGDQRAIAAHGDFHDDGEGTPDRAVGVVQDVTERKERERELERIERQFEAAFNNPSAFIGLLDPDGTVRRINDTALEFAGIDEASVQGEKFWETPWFAHSERVRSTVRDGVERAADGEYVRAELEHQSPDGEIAIIDAMLEPVHDEVGDVVAVMPSGRDITGRKEHERYQRELYEITADPGLSTDEKIDRLLEVGCDYLDLSVGMMNRERGETFEIVHMHGTHPDLREGAVTPSLKDAYCRRVVDTGSAASVADAEAAGWDEDPLYEQFDLQCYAGTPVTVDGESYGTVCFTDTAPRREFTEAEQTFLDLLGRCIAYELGRKEYERELEETVDQLQQSNERLEQFAYAASHDLQEPLRMVTSYLQLLERRYSDAFDKEGEEFLEFAVDGADRMREMIEGLLEYSRVETRGESFEPVRLDAVLADVREDLQLQIEETDAEITAAELPLVAGDASQLRQLFQNLLDNALTYSDDEPPRVAVDAERREAEWVISVEDEGIGIDPDEQNRVFTVFDRLHSRDEYDGTGLGLALCQRIVERHGGEIWVDSEPGEGTTFSFTIPVLEE